MKIQIISVGKLDKTIEVLCNKYTKMLSWNVVHVELPHSKKTQFLEVKKDETKNIINRLRQDAYVVLLDVAGRQISSEDFSRIFDKQMLASKELDFVIGGAYGFDQSIYSKIDFRLSLSMMTLPHQMAKLFLIEQIYRAESIIKNHPYHK